MQISKFITTLFFTLITSILCFSQNVTLGSQADVDAFDPSTTIINGDLFIGGTSSSPSDIYDLSNLSNLVQIHSLYIEYNNALTNLDALSNLTAAIQVGRLYIRYNNVLTNIDGLSNLDLQNTSFNHLKVEHNPTLTNIDGLSNISAEIRTLEIRYNDSLLNIDGLLGINSVANHIYITDNPALINLDGFTNVTSANDDIDIDNNASLVSINGLSNINTGPRSLTITNNPSLESLPSFSSLTSIDYYLEISGNNRLSSLDAFPNLSSTGYLTINNNDSLTNINSLSNLNLIKNALSIYNNPILENLDGLSNLNTIGTQISPGVLGSSLLIKDNHSLTNIDGLANLTSIKNSLEIIDNDALPNLDGLSNLQSVGGEGEIIGNLEITDNDNLSNINGLINLTKVWESLYINQNDILSNISGLSNIDSIGEMLYIKENPSLFQLHSLASLTHINSHLIIQKNPVLNNLDGLSSLSYVGGYLNLSYNDSLSNLDGLSNLSSVEGYFSITNNLILDNCCGIQNILITPNAIGGNISISDNLMHCNSQIEILDDNCGNNINIIEGNIFLDNDANCLYNQEDIPYEGIIVQANSYEYTYTTATDSLGDYKIYLDTGSYEVKSYMANPYTQACTSSFLVDILDNTVSDSFYFEFPTIVNTQCPYLEVDISTWALRECFDNNYSVQYCNSGTVDATNAYIEIELDDVLSIISSNIPFIGPDNNNIYTFDIGTVNIGDCGNFSLNVHLPCDSLNAGQFQGQTFCIDAHIYPDSICLPPSSIWDGSSIHVIGQCIQDSVQFRIRNVGSGDMLSGKTLQVFEDQVMFIDSPFQLESGEEMILSYFANGSTYRLEAEQSDGHPGNSNPSVAVEGCGAGPIFSLGFINQFSQDDGDVFVSSECREVTGSYDPNDKQAFPVGYGEEHFIEKNTDIEYLIRFQNTGTDTAFTVVITDEISPLLDITTIQPGASSHPYVFEIDSVVRFTFNNILLVDSLTNEAESHGFIKFRISQQDDLPNGTLLENTAKIYFDFNAPIITNTAFHTIGENFVTIDLIDGIESLVQISSIKAYPNPFSDVIHFELEGNVFEDIILSVFDVNGRQVASKNYNSGTFQFSREDLISGVYFYTISSEGVNIANGKMVLR